LQKCAVNDFQNVALQAVVAVRWHDDGKSSSSSIHDGNNTGTTFMYPWVPSLMSERLADGRWSDLPTATSRSLQRSSIVAEQRQRRMTIARTFAGATLGFAYACTVNGLMKVPLSRRKLWMQEILNRI
jgi:hypothetical protein